MSADITETRPTWLPPGDLEQARAQLPVVYIDAVPVRVDGSGLVTQVGLLLTATEDGMLTRAFVAGRVNRGERIRHALLRHVEKDLGPMALPRVPASPQPFTVVEYFPDPTITGYHDERQHAVSLAYLVPVDGDCQTSRDSLELAWLTPLEAMSPDVLVELPGGRDRLLRIALAHAGVLP